MPLYDLMLLLDPTAPSDRHEAILKEVDSMLKSSGTVRGDYDWGTRKLAFEIDHRPEAAYHLVQFETAPGGELLERIDHSLKIMDGVLRHRIVRLKDGSPPPPMPRPEGRRDWESAPDAAPAEAAADAEAVPDAADAVPAAAEVAPAETTAADAAPAETADADAAPVSADAVPAEPDAAPAEIAEAEPAPAEGDDDGPAAA